MYLAIRRATDQDVNDVLAVTKESFSLYQDELHVRYEVKALKETIESTVVHISVRRELGAYQYGVRLGVAGRRYRLCQGQRRKGDCFAYKFQVLQARPLLLRQTVLRTLHLVRPRLRSRAVRFGIDRRLRRRLIARILAITRRIRRYRKIEV